jgi:hypothetical protein
MPPHTEDAVGFQDNANSLSVNAIGASPSFRKKIIPEHVLSLNNPKQVIPHVKNNTEAEKEHYVREFSTALSKLQTHVEHLLKIQSHTGETNKPSPANDACLWSLRNKMPRFLERASLLIERLKSNGTDEIMVGKLRCSFAMAAAVQFLDMLEYGMICPARDIIDARLSTVLEEVARLTNHDEFFVFRVSHWVAPSHSLAFDLPACKPATLELHDDFPLTVTIEPLITYLAEDLYNVSKELPELRMCSVKIETCKHNPLTFAEGAGIIGTALIRVRFTPLHDPSSQSGVWNESGTPIDKLSILEARA